MDEQRPGEEWTNDDRAAARAFLQRCEVRLSTLHRVATALLSGAGLMVLMPAMMKDQIYGVLGALLTVEPTVPHVMLAAIAIAVLGLPLAVFFLLLGDITRFYFHAQHVPSTSGSVFAPRFTLTGLRLPLGELSAGAARTLDEARHDPATVELVVPQNPRGRAMIDDRLAAYGGLGLPADLTDDDRAAGLFELIASRQRDLAEEVAKVEFGMTRHLLRLQVIVMRYVKSLLAFLVTATAVFGAAAAVNHNPDIGPNAQLWLASIFALWAPAMVLAVSSPVRWVEGLLRAEGASVQRVAGDHEFTRFERLAIKVGAVVLVLAAAILALRIAADVSRFEIGVAAAVILVSITTFVLAARRSLIADR